MSGSQGQRSIDARSKVYLQALAITVPAFGAWLFAGRYLYPKLQLIWREGGATGSDAEWLMDTVSGLVRFGWLGVVLAIITIIVVEFWPTLRARRSLIVGSGVTLANSVILLGLVTLCVLVLSAAPGLKQP